MGSMINFAVVSYCEHATFFTGGHAHGAMLSVQGDIPLADILFRVRHVTKPEDWSTIVQRTALWSVDDGLALMMVMSMLLTGLYQFCVLPVINCCKHATFFTGGHAHGAVFGV